MTPEKEIQNRILEHLSLIGIFAFPIFNGGIYDPARGTFRKPPKYFVYGIPDIAAVLPSGRMLWIEVKSPKGRVSDNQKSVHKKLADLGHTVIVVRSVWDIVELMSSTRY